MFCKCGATCTTNISTGMKAGMVTFICILTAVCMPERRGPEMEAGESGVRVRKKGIRGGRQEGFPHIFGYLE